MPELLRPQRTRMLSTPPPDPYARSAAPDPYARSAAPDPYAAV